MNAKSNLPHIQDQYERYPFPVRLPEDEHTRLIASEIDRLAKIDHHCFGGQRDFEKSTRILVAGGGTGDALIFLAEQLRECPAEFVYLDMSSASLETARARAAVRGLENIEWIQASLLDLDAQSIGHFDYINCVGVLHHLKDPRAGLESLVSCLSPDGALGLMLYGQFGRKNVYLLQEMLNQFFGPDTELSAKVELTRQIFGDLGRMGRLEFGEGALNLLKDRRSDAYLVDTYLHGQDRAYTVTDIHELLSSCGLELAGFTNFFDDQGFTCALDYDPQVFFSDSDLLARVGSLEEPNRGQIAEILGGKTSMHAFYATRNSRAAATARDIDHAPNFVSSYGQTVADSIIELDLQSISLRLNCGIERELPIGPVARALLRGIDGRKSTRELVEIVSQGQAEIDPLQSMEAVLGHLDLLIRLGLVTLRSPDLKPFAPQHSSRPWNGAIDLRPFADL